MWESSSFRAVGRAPTRRCVQVASGGRVGPAPRPRLSFSSSHTKKVAEFAALNCPLSFRLPASAVVSSRKSPTVSRLTFGTLYEAQAHRWSRMMGPPSSSL